MTQYIDKDALIAKVEKRRNKHFNSGGSPSSEYCYEDDEILNIIDTIKAHAETYSFNIESELFNQLTKEQQKLWRKEIEQACISGGDEGYSLAKDIRYKENVEMKDVDLEKEVNDYGYHYDYVSLADRKELVDFAKHFFELGMSVNNKAQKGEEV